MFEDVVMNFDDFSRSWSVPSGVECGEHSGVACFGEILSCCCSGASTCGSSLSFTMQQDLSNLTREAQYLGGIFDHTDGELVL
jgi:hypothetical protein